MEQTLVIFVVISFLSQNEAKLETSGTEIQGVNQLDTTSKLLDIKSYQVISTTHKNLNNTKKITFTKCCLANELYNVSAEGCIQKPINISFNITSIYANHTNLESMLASGKYDYKVKIINCTVFPKTIMSNIAPHEFEILENGSVLLHRSENSYTNGDYGPNHYCMDYFFTDLTKHKISIPYLYEFTAAVCTPEVPATNYTVRSICMLISCFFIILTVAVYAWLPELRNLHGMVLMAYLISFFVGFLFLAILQLFIIGGSVVNLDDKRVNFGSEICVAFSLIIYYGIIAAFFWMNVMCYDIWRAVREMQSNCGSRRYLDRMQFRKYCIYAFGVPIILTGILATHEFVFDKEHELHPTLRSKKCFLADKSKFVYLYLPLLLLCVANVVFFGHTSYYILRTTKQIVDSKKKVIIDSNRNANLSAREHKKRFIVYVKLFVVMGITWIFEVVAFIWKEYDYIWQYTDIYNIMFGLTVFVIFVCKRQIWEKIKHRLNIPSSISGKSGIHTSTTLSTRADTQCKEEIPINCITKN